MKQANLKANWAIVQGVFFLLFASNLLVSIILTINTSPGIIPDDREWDMSTEDYSSDELNLLTTADERE